MSLPVIFLFLVSSCFAQQYPEWFVYQPPGTVAGIANIGISPDSSIRYALKDGIIKVKQKRNLAVTGNQGFWSTEGGNFFMGSDYKILYDSADNVNAVKIDSFCNKNIALVLIAETSRKISSSSLVSFPGKMPEWCKLLPESNNYYFAVGISEKYYYEASSWLSAEQNALLNMAKQINVKIESVQKIDRLEGQQIKNETTKAQLSNYEVKARWKDFNNGLFYVLMRMRK